MKTLDELAKDFMELHQRRLVQGLFLSSGIKHQASTTMQSMLDTVEILRRKFQYKGCIHLKIMPGAPFDCVEEACRIADRVSVNIEAPAHTGRQIYVQAVVLSKSNHRALVYDKKENTY